MIRKLLRKLGLSSKAAVIVDMVAEEAADKVTGGKLKKVEKVVKGLK